MTRKRSRLISSALTIGLGLVVGGCFDSNPADPGGEEPLWDLDQCDFDLTYVADGGVGFDGIPAISNPIMVDATEGNEIGYLENTHRVIGIVVGGQPMAFPLSALWHHEVLNLDQGGTQLVVIHGTLSGSSRVFLRSAASGANFGVSGLLYRNNIIVYDRSDSPSLWAQLPGEGRCGPGEGTSLVPYPFVEGTWAGWLNLHPNTLVLSGLTAQSPLWGQYPYGNYEETPDFFFSEAMPPLDGRRAAKERVLGVREGTQGGIAFPFGEFPESDELAVAHGEVGGRGLVVFWKRDLQGAAAFWAEGGGQSLTFTVQDGHFADQETGTTWSFTGTGSAGELDGVQLESVAEATVAYWGAWAAFFAATEIWERNGG